MATIKVVLSNSVGGELDSKVIEIADTTDDSAIATAVSEWLGGMVLDIGDTIAIRKG